MRGSEHLSGLCSLATARQRPQPWSGPFIVINSTARRGPGSASGCARCHLPGTLFHNKLSPHFGDRFEWFSRERGGRYPEGPGVTPPLNSVLPNPTGAMKPVDRRVGTDAASSDPMARVTRRSSPETPPHRHPLCGWRGVGSAQPQDCGARVRLAASPDLGSLP